MKKLLKKCVCMTLVVCMMASMMISDASIVNAASFSTTPSSPDDKFYVSYDSSKYTIYWVSRTKITSRSQYGSMWSDLDKGDKLGTATIRAYYLEPKSSTGGYYYAMAGCQISMDPSSLRRTGDVFGMSQLAHIKIQTINEDSRVCSPTKEVLNIQASKTTSSSGNFTAGTGVKYNFSTKSWEASGQFSFGNTWGSSSSYTYNKTNVSLTQHNKDGVYAGWKYDYKSKDGDITWNEYLFSSSKVAGQVVYRLNGKPTYSNRANNIPVKLSYDIRFGAGDTSTGEVANRLGPSTNRDMSIMTGTIYFSY